MAGSLRSSARRPGATEIRAPAAASRLSSRHRYQRIAPGQANSPSSTGLCADHGRSTVSRPYRPSASAASSASHSSATLAVWSSAGTAEKSVASIIPGIMPAPEPLAPR